MKKFLLMGLALVVCLVTLTGCGKEEKKENNKNSEEDKSLIVNNKPAELQIGEMEDYSLNESIKLTDIKFSVSDERSFISSSVTNVTDKPIDIYELHLYVKDADGKEIIELIARIEGLEAGETKHFETAVASKIENYKTVEYKIFSKPE